MKRLANADIAKILTQVRTLMEFAGEPFFKFMAYERAAETLQNAPPVAELVAAGRLEELPGIGKTIAGRITEICTTGSCAYLEELRAKYPLTLVELLGVSGVGMKTAQQLFGSLGIASLADLEAALAADRLDGLPRLGAKTIDNMRRGVLAYKGRQRRTPLGQALPIARAIVAYLAETTDAADLTHAGSVRRQEPTVGDIDILCTSNNPTAVIAAFTHWEQARSVLAQGETKASIWLASGLQIDLRVLPEHVYGNLLQHFTGSREHNIQLRELAVRKNLRVSENGIVDLTDGTTTTCRTEEEVYAKLGLPYIPPELRLGIGEIEAARAGTLPAVVELTDLRGDFHMHCTWSDGRNTLEAMIAAAAARGYAYHSVSDHSALNISREDMTRRLIRACENPYVNIIGHPTGRNVETFPGYEFDYDAVFAAAARTGTALEIDGQPNRLDLPSALARRAHEFGVTFTCDSDAHGADQLANVAYAVGQAKRAWLEPSEILNTRDLAGVLAFVNAKRERADDEDVSRCPAPG
jgi:DNA polymerase (family 10)